MVWLYHSLFDQLSIEGHLGCLQFCTVTNKDDTNMYVQIFFSVHSLLLLWDERPRVQMARVYGSCMFSLLRGCQTDFQSGWTILQSHQQCWSEPVFPHWVLMRGITSIAFHSWWLAAQCEPDITAYLPLLGHLGRPWDIKDRQREGSSGLFSVTSLFLPHTPNY